MTVVVLSADLMDRSKIAIAHPHAVFVRSADALLEQVRRPDQPGAVDLVIVDLTRRGALEAVAELSAEGVEVVGYGAHVDDELLAAGRAAGCIEVLPRSRFFARLARPH